MISGRKNASGQALIEWALLVPLYVLLLVAVFNFGEWFLIRQQLHQAAKLGAFLYSSGRVEKPQVQRLVQRALERGVPSLAVSLDNIDVGRSDDTQAHLFKLDKVAVRYQPPEGIGRYFMGLMEESCTIKHAPPYFGELGIGVNPPVNW